jgi:hypothetical protein
MLRIFLVLVLLLILPFWGVHAAKYATVPNPQPPTYLVAKCDNGNISSTACGIAKDLSSLSPPDIATYGLINQEPTVIEQSLRLLDNFTLNKVLQSITGEELSHIRQKLTNQTFDDIVPKPLREPLLNRLSLN